MNANLLLTVTVGGLAALDATPIAQTLLSQPLVTATVLGAVWGDWRTALEVGVVLQILAASTLPVGSRTPEDYAVGGVVGAGTALMLAHRAPVEHMREAAALAGCVAGMLAATSGVPLLKWQRRCNEGLARWCEVEIRAGREQALGVAHAAAISLSFAVGLASCAAWLGIASLAAPTVEGFSLRLAGAWTLLRPAWLGFGFAQLVHAFVQRRLVRTAVFGAALMGAWLALVIGTP